MKLQQTSVFAWAISSKKVSLGFYQNNNTGELTSAVTTDLSFFEMYATNMIDVVVNSYIFVLTIVLCMGFVNL